jgi:hypothetical protein
MAKAGFYNDNEYRAYPFIDKQPTTERQQQLGGADAYDKIKDAIHSAIVDAGFIFGVDCDGAPQQQLYGLRVQLASIAAHESSNGFTASFISTATAHVLTFTTGVLADGWTTIKNESAATVTALNCGSNTPAWRGYIVASAANTLRSSFAAAGIPLVAGGQRIFTPATTDAAFEFEIEPCRIQNKARSYLRSITVGNFDRVRVPPCGSEAEPEPRAIVITAPCLSGPIFFQEGYNCQITQIDRTNTLTFSARKDAGAKKDAAYCANNGEIPLHVNEEKPANSKFYSGGPACDELIYTINGVGGRNVSLIPGTGITISTENNKIVVGTRGNLSADCANSTQDTQTP